MIKRKVFTNKDSLLSFDNILEKVMEFINSNNIISINEQSVRASDGCLYHWWFIYHKEDND